ncbi:hypothetical protein K469DRAFT_716140 [Zopfia rhizophila CBS 207.26]|uniref:Uncharacterized protein n=1 Tax=Zopfia rhizophila CBS 207.26 TaxID=1314779 RepID=A0A6A6DMP1_9PEZI|nr:hypothetical protein K469DRAFT_716140 [Zopfia rhizophila CBS 207.26]
MPSHYAYRILELPISKVTQSPARSLFDQMVQDRQNGTADRVIVFQQGGVYIQSNRY